MCSICASVYVIYAYIFACLLVLCFHDAELFRSNKYDMTSVIMPSSMKRYIPNSSDHELNDAR